jgi:hypothetical protein
MKLLIILLVTVTIFIQCEKKEPEFFKMDIQSNPFIEPPDSANRQIPVFREVYVIASPPGNPEKLRKMVDEFNAKTLHLPDSIPTYSYYRKFYKETRSTPRNYQEDERSGDDILNHFKDLLLMIEWGKSASSDYTDYTFYRNEKIWDEKSFNIVHKKNGK